MFNLMATIKNTASVTPTFVRMFNEKTQALNLLHMKSTKHLEGMRELLESGRCKTVSLADTENPDVVLKVLSIMSMTSNVLTRIHLDIWNTDYENILNVLRDCLMAHEATLEELILKCRFPTSILTRVLGFLPRGLKVLDISENTLSDSYCLTPLLRYIENSKLEVLRLINCKIKPSVIEDFVKLMFKIETPFSLSKIVGLDLSNCTEIPKSVRKCLNEPAYMTRKKQMNYKDHTGIGRYDTSVQFIDHLRNIIFMKRLVGSMVRVWWPPTEDHNKTAFAGRFWPGTVMMVNPIDLVFVVKYDNDEVDHVPCKYIQPMSPYMYGGGFTSDYLGRLLGRSPLSSGAHKPASNTNYKNISEVTSYEFSTTPENNSETSFVSTCSGLTESAISSTKYDESFVCKNCGYLNTPERISDTGNEFDSVETMLGLETKYMGNLLVPGEFVEFRDPLDQFRNDPSDYLAVVSKVNPSEPMYECVCVYLDNNEVVSVHSRDIRRAVVIPWYNWVGLAFRLLNSMDSPNFNNHTPKRFLDDTQNCFEPLKPKKRDSEDTTISSQPTACTLKDHSDSEREESEDENVFNPNFFHLPILNLQELDDYCPSNPLEMKVVKMEDYSKLVSNQVLSHLKLRVKNETDYHHNNSDLKLKSLLEYNEILQMELQAERNKNIELQSKFKCILCFETEINCVLDPCAHFSFCYGCAKNLRTCPICRHEIARLKILNLN